MGRTRIRRSSPMRAFRACDAPNTTHRRALLIAAAAIALASADAGAGIINNKSFFNSLPTTTINFETTGAGAAVPLVDGQTLTMPTSAYQNLGVLFQSPIAWVNDGGIDFDIAQFIGGSPDNSIPSSAVASLVIQFTTPVRSVGFFVANTYSVDGVGPTFVARDAQGNILQSVSFGTQTGASQFVAGRVGTADYGFMGLTSVTPIATLSISKQAAILDDLMFSSQIPAPASALALGALAFWAGPRRRR